MPQDLRLLLSRAARSATLYFKDRAAEQDLSVVQAQALIEIDQEPGISLGGLAASLSKDLASTSILIDRMTTLGLVRRDTDPRDRRRNQLYVTQQAQPTVSHLKDAREDINHLVLDLLGAQQATHLATLLSNFLDALATSEAVAAKSN
ncbi:MAG TPA: MarR family winged helix-turn-helix transcriptional regulator [Dehalococcoidia bacterium]|nr:MarR family winged helix-turn-helix transcriptional regulator [Dehalococcoidia bacterium]